MRKLKFRVWSSKYNNYTDTAPEFVLGLAGEIISNFGDLDNKEYIVEQFTGLVDMEGKEIYEGDVIKQGRESRTVEWGASGWLPFEDWDDYNRCGQNFDEGCLVVGNIHEP